MGQIGESKCESLYNEQLNNDLITFYAFLSVYIMLFNKIFNVLPIEIYINFLSFELVSVYRNHLII